MKIEKSAGAVLFRDEGRARLYLLLSRPRQTQSGGEKKVKSDVWDFPKGNIEEGERPLDAARREVGEETGIKDLEFVDGFKKTIRVFYQWEGEKRLKFITFFLAETLSDKITISFEHNNYAWLPFEEAVDRLSFKNSKEILKEVEEFIRSRV